MRSYIVFTCLLSACGDGGLSAGGACKGLDEASCRGRSDCAVGQCAGCTGGPSFAGCYDPKIDQAPPCPGIACAPACSDVKDLATCKQRSDCHPVFADPGTCLCAQPGCCQMFQRCAEPDKADCKGPALCKRLPPTCEGDYVVAYDPSTSCYEGCVLKTDCAP
jgi:hypothetical protein